MKFDKREEAMCQYTHIQRYKKYLPLKLCIKPINKQFVINTK